MFSSGAIQQTPPSRSPRTHRSARGTPGTARGGGVGPQLEHDGCEMQALDRGTRGSSSGPSSLRVEPTKIRSRSVGGTDDARRGRPSWRRHFRALRTSASAADGAHCPRGHAEDPPPKPLVGRADRGTRGAMTHGAVPAGSSTRSRAVRRDIRRPRARAVSNSSGSSDARIHRRPAGRVRSGRRSIRPDRRRTVSLAEQQPGPLDVARRRRAGSEPLQGHAHPILVAELSAAGDPRRTGRGRFAACEPRPSAVRQREALDEDIVESPGVLDARRGSRPRGRRRREAWPGCRARGEERREGRLLVNVDELECPLLDPSARSRSGRTPTCRRCRAWCGEPPEGIADGMEQCDAPLDELRSTSVAGCEEPDPRRKAERDRSRTRAQRYSAPRISSIQAFATGGWLHIDQVEEEAQDPVATWSTAPFAIGRRPRRAGCRVRLESATHPPRGPLQLRSEFCGEAQVVVGECPASLRRMRLVLEPFGCDLALERASRRAAGRDRRCWRRRLPSMSSRRVPSRSVAHGSPSVTASTASRLKSPGTRPGVRTAASPRRSAGRSSVRRSPRSCAGVRECPGRM